MKKISLIDDKSISKQDINKAIDWLKTYPRLTQGNYVKKFRFEWSSYLGVNHSIFCNSGSSANLLMLNGLKQSGRLKSKKIVVPALCWSTTISPILQLGLDPIIVDVEYSNLGLDPYELEKLAKQEQIGAVLLVHVLGIPARVVEIKRICDKYGIILLEDSCETVGSTYYGKKTGTFGLMSSFSFYFAHHISTVEGGMVCTDDKEIANILLMTLEHGWNRTLDQDDREALQKKYRVDDFNALFTFYMPGFNFRNTEFAAFIGCEQIQKLDGITKTRKDNYETYQNNLNNGYWKIAPDLAEEDFDNLSNFAYPIIHPHRDSIVQDLKENDIECRPLICGNIANHPAFYDCRIFGELIIADLIHKQGFYIPNHTGLTKTDIRRVCSIINKYTG